MGLSGGDAALLQAAKARPEEHNSVSDGTRIGIEEQLMAYLTVIRFCTPQGGILTPLRRPTATTCPPI
jgi:hypothetical protein